MPVGVPTPRHRAPSAHNTVASMREMSVQEEQGQHPPPMLMPPWANGMHGSLPHGMPPPPPPQHPTGMPAGIPWGMPPPPPFPMPGMTMQGPPPPPPPQWGMPAWGAPPHPSQLQHPPPPSMLTTGFAGYPHPEDSASEGEDEEGQGGAEWAGMYPPPPGFAGMPPPPMQWGQNHMPQPPPPPPPPPQHIYEEDVEESSEEEDDQRGLSRRERRMSEGGSGGGGGDSAKLRALYEQISKIRSTSPSNRQVANLRRLQKHMQEDAERGGSPQLSAEDQRELQEIQRRGSQATHRAAVRQATHESTVRAIRSENRTPSTVLQSTASSRQKRSTALVERSRTRAHSTQNKRSKSLPRDVPTPPIRPVSGSQIHTVHRQTTYAAPAQVQRSPSPTHPKKKRALHEPQNRNASYVKEFHQRLQGGNDADGSEEEDEAVLGFLKQRVLEPKVKAKMKPKGRMQQRSGSGNRRSRGSRDEVSGGGGYVVPTEKDYCEGLEDLHQKLRKTYLELQRHPQRLLSQLTLQGSVATDAHPQSATEILADLDVCNVL